MSTPNCFLQSVSICIFLEEKCAVVFYIFLLSAFLWSLSLCMILSGICGVTSNCILVPSPFCNLPGRKNELPFIICILSSFALRMRVIFGLDGFRSSELDVLDQPGRKKRE